jgi:hypothetical protein
MVYDPDDGVVFGSAEKLRGQHTVVSNRDLAASRLAVNLQWDSEELSDPPTQAMGPRMYSPVVRGSPYGSMVYVDATPRLYVQRELAIGTNPIVDQGDAHCP